MHAWTLIDRILCVLAILRTTTAAPPPVHANVPGCWEDTTRFSALTFKDCIEVIDNEITRGYDPDQPLRFSNDPAKHPDILLPKYWRRPGVKCGVGLDFRDATKDYDTTTLNDVKQAAKLLAIACVIKPPHIGGYLELGWRNKMGALIAGKKPRLDEGNNVTLAMAAES